MKLVLEMMAKEEEMLSPGEFLKLREKRPEAIKSSRIIPPKIGRRGDFGKILVVYKSPGYEKISGL